MKAPLYDKVHQLAIEIVNASANEEEKAGKKAYSALEKLCFENSNKKSNHPLQWEALGDFSENFEDAKSAYEKGISSARQLALPDYECSILFASAELNFENGNRDIAQKLIAQASSIQHSDTELKKAISSFIEEHQFK